MRKLFEGFDIVCVCTGGLKLNLCEKCLKATDRAGECSCGHETPWRVSELLGRRVFEAGKREIGSAIRGKIRNAINEAGGLNEISVLSVPVKVSPFVIDDLKFDVTGNVTEKEIIDVGIKKMEELVSEKKKNLEKITGIPIAQEIAARVIAYLYDGDKGEHALTEVQNISGLGINSFFLGDDVLRSGLRHRVYRLQTEPVLIVMGGAMLESTRGPESSYATRVRVTAFPLGIIYQAEDFRNSRLFIYL